MPETLDIEELKPGLIIFRRGDVKHRRWYCRLKVPDEDRYKTHSLKTIDIETAKNRAYDHDAELRFKVKHEMPVFNRTFAQVAQEYSDKEKGRAEVEQITLHRWRIQDSHIRTQLNRFLGKHQITLIGQDRWQEYPVWRQRNGKGRSGGKVSDATIRSEMATLKSVMLYAASKQYIRDSQVFKGKIPISKARREELIERFLVWIHELQQVRDVKTSGRTVNSCVKTEECIRQLTASVRERMTRFNRAFHTFWADINRESFQTLQQQIEKNHDGMGAVLCGLLVKIRSWSYEFPDNTIGSPMKRATFVMTEIEPGLDKLKQLENTARRSIGLPPIA